MRGFMFFFRTANSWNSLFFSKGRYFVSQCAQTPERTKGRTPFVITKCLNRGLQGHNKKISIRLEQLPEALGLTGNVSTRTPTGDLLKLQITEKHTAGVPLSAKFKLSANCYIALFKHRPTQ